MSSRRQISLMMGASLAASIVSHQALAQQAPDAATAVQEIVITAERQAERLDRVPIAASVISGKDLNQKGVVDISDLSSQTPSLSIQTQGGILQYVNIRGVGLQATNPATSSGVAVYSDGFFIPHETAISDPYFDVAQIEVLRGPQGTLVGQSSTGGALFVNSVRPTFDRYSGYIQGTIENYGYYQGEGAINLPISDTLAIRIGAHIEEQDSFYKNINPATRSNQPGDLENGSALRVGVDWKPSSNVEIYLKSEIDNSRGGGPVGKPYGEVVGASPSALMNPALLDPFVISYNTPSFQTYYLSRTSAEIDWNLASNLTLRSISGYQYERTRTLFDQDFNDFASQTLVQDFSETTEEQEFDLISKNTGPFNWLLGVFYLHDTVPVTLVNNQGPVIVDINARPVEDSYAVFGQGTYDLTPHWQIVLGGRYNYDRKTLSGTTANIFPAFPFLNTSGPLTGTTTTSQPTGKVAINYLPDDRTMFYLSATRGFKAGGTNPFAPLVFKPETINAYEAGVKTSQFDRRLNLTAAAFYYDYHDMQLSLLSPDPVAAALGVAAITNAPKATVYGAEAEGVAHLGPLVLNGAVGYTHSRIDSLVAIDSRNIFAGPQNLAGSPLAYAPQWTANVGATYTVPLSFGSLAARVQYSYASTQYITPFELVTTAYSPLNGFDGINDVIAGHGLVDANLTLRLRNGISLEGFATNLGNVRYVAGSDLGSEVWGAPRQYGARLSYVF